MEKFEINPFDRSALTDYRLLAGRKNEFTQIRFILRNASNQRNRIKSILISGDRGVGKTSFLNLIEAECLSNNLIPIRINLTETNSTNSNEFFWYLFSQLISAVFSLKFFGGKAGPIDAAIQKILYSDGLSDHVNYVFRTPILRKNYLQNHNSTFEFDQLVDDLKSIRKEICESEGTQFNEKTKFYFLVDESQNIYSNSKIIEDIRYIIQHQDIGIGFVFAGDTTYISSKWEQIFGGSHREFEIINLNYFKEVESVIDYFAKSLESIGWTSDEIEDKLFYRFKHACRQIFYVTSGKPAWINIIASKMFERCMNKEASILRFDRQSQEDIKKVLEDSGQLDRVKLDFIDRLTPKLQKWLGALFSCELSTFEIIYFYSKFKLTGDNFLDINDYTQFCEDLVNRGILYLVEKKSDSTIGYKQNLANKNFLQNQYFAFGFESDSMKQWLQINTEGRFSFGFEAPGNQFMNFINLEFVNVKSNSIIFSTPFVPENEAFRLSNIVNKINNNEYIITDELFQSVLFIYKFYKKLSNSKERQVLYGVLKDLNSGKVKTWNIYNYDDSGKLVGFIDAKNKLNKYISNVSAYKSNNHNYELELVIDKIEKQDIEHLQKIIIESKDTKKIGIILEDKLRDLIEFYIKDSDVDSSFKTAIFFYRLYEEGYDLDIETLNNSAYVFLAKNDLEKAQALLIETKRKITFDNLDKADIGTACIVLYNYAILQIMKDDFPTGIDAFKNVLDYINSKDKIDDTATVLNILQVDENNKIIIKEIKEGDKVYPNINCKDFALNNIKIIENYIPNLIMNNNDNA